MTGRARRAGRVAAAVVAVVLVSATAACGSPDAAISDPDVTLFSPLTGAEAAALSRTLEPFTARTGITVRLVSTTNLEVDLVERVQADEPPDVALVPQPGLLRGLVEQLAAPQPLTAQVLDPLRANYDQRWIDLTTVGGRTYGVPVQASAKSLVWYSPATFADLGYRVPGTWQELVDLVVAMVDDTDVVPWCLGMSDGDATGWVGTDWIEDVVLRPADPDADGAATFDAWVAGEVEFASDPVRAAFDEAGSLALRSTLASPPARRILTTPVQQVGLGLLGDDPDCLLHRQASFAGAWLPDGTDIGPGGDVDVFPLPDRDGGPAPMLMAGQLAVAFRDRPEVWSLLAYLATPEGVEGWAQTPGYLSPHDDFPLQAYGSDFDRRVAEMVASASLWRFDGSDQMPYEVGVGSFWRGMESFVSGAPTQVLLEGIDLTWPDPGDPLGLRSGAEGGAGLQGVLDEADIGTGDDDLPESPAEQDPLAGPPVAEPDESDGPDQTDEPDEPDEVPTTTTTTSTTAPPAPSTTDPSTTDGDPTTTSVDG